MYFSKILNNFTKNSITTIYKQNHNYNIRKKNIYYELLQNKNITNKLPVCKSILPYTPLIPNTKIRKLPSVPKIPNIPSIPKIPKINASIGQITNKHINNYSKLIIISSIASIITYSSVYFYLFINNIGLLFCS